MNLDPLGNPIDVDASDRAASRANDPSSPAPPSSVVSPPRPRTSRWVIAAIVLGAIVIANLVARVGVLESSGIPLDGTVNDLSLPGPISTTTLALPIDLPPPDAEVARRAIVGTWTTLFTSDVAEERAAALTEPGQLVDQFAAFAASSCTAITVYVTDIRFVDAETAAVRFRFEGSGVPEGGTGLQFDGTARRVGEQWLAEPGGIAEVLELAGPYCEVTTTTLG